MNLNDDLDVFLVTYNRLEKLKYTLSKLFQEDSPLKNVRITVLDNCSDDGTSEYLADFKERYPNLIHIRHKKNIGGNANVTRAMEMASKKYFWILCDDDDYDWSHWREVEAAMTEEADCIMVERNLPKAKQKLEIIFNELGFCPAGIYKTENLTATVLQNAFVNIYAQFPHLALVADIINKNKTIFITDHTVITQGWELKTKKEYVRGFEKNIHFRQNSVNQCVCYINSAQLIEDKKLRYKIIDNLYLGKTFSNVAHYILRNNFSIYNLFDALIGINFRQKLIFFTKLSPIIVYKTEKGITLKCFYLLKIRIWKFRK